MLGLVRRVFRKRPQGVTRTLSAAKQGGAERPGDGCPCVGAEETCGARHLKQSRTQAPQTQKLYLFGERKNPADSEESAGFSVKCAPWDSNPEPID